MHGGGPRNATIARINRPSSVTRFSSRFARPTNISFGQFSRVFQIEISTRREEKSVCMCALENCSREIREKFPRYEEQEKNSCSSKRLRLICNPDPISYPISRSPRVSVSLASSIHFSTFSPFLPPFAKSVGARASFADRRGEG